MDGESSRQNGHESRRQDREEVIVIVNDDTKAGTKLTEEEKERLREEIQAALNVADEIADVVDEMGTGSSEEVEVALGSETDPNIEDDVPLNPRQQDMFAAYEEAIGDGDSIQVPERWKCMYLATHRTVLTFI